MINFAEQAAFNIAEKYFIKTCCFDLTNPRHKLMLAEGMEVRDQITESIRIRAKIRTFENEVFRNHKISISGAEFFCPAFQHINEKNVEAVYIYVLTVGNIDLDDYNSVSKKYYAHVWGNSYIDAGRELLTKEISREIEKKLPGQLGKSLHLSNTFGPGFYGMSILQSKEIFDILDLRGTGIQITENGNMLPLKTVAGIYFVVKDEDELPNKACSQCISKSLGCNSCKKS